MDGCAVSQFNNHWELLVRITGNAQIHDGYPPHRLLSSFETFLDPPLSLSFPVELIYLDASASFAFCTLVSRHLGWRPYRSLIARSSL